MCRFFVCQSNAGHRFFALPLLVLAMLVAISTSVLGQQPIPDRVLDIFDSKCTFSGCHVGANPRKGLDLSEESAYTALVNVKSVDAPKFLLVKPGDPENSYLLKKLRGSPDIKGDRMPKNTNPLSSEEIAEIADWIKSLAPAPGPQAEPTGAPAFPGWSVANLPTTETLSKGAFLYRIAHRFRGPVSGGLDRLFGLDDGAFMMTEVAFPVAKALSVSFERSSIRATYEVAAKWRFLNDNSTDSLPLSAAIYAGLDWATLKDIADPSDAAKNLSRTAGERFSYFVQLPVSKKIGSQLAVLAVPGVLLNGNVGVENEDALMTIGIGGRYRLNDKYALFVEVTPIISGDKTATPVGGTRAEGSSQVYNDTFAVGFEIKVGGHVFHVFATNSAGNTTDQYMNGANYSFSNTDNIRLGFNIYRLLDYPL